MTLGSIPVSSRAAGNEGAPSAESEVAAARAPAGWALQFQIGRNFSLQKFHDLQLALERRLSPRSALRLGIDSRTYAVDQDNSRSAGSPSVTDRLREQRNYDLEVVALSAQYVSYPNPGRKLRLYWTVGPRSSVSRRDQALTSSRVADDRTSTSKISLRNHDWSAGLDGALGVEWLASDTFGLLAEYGAAARFFFGNGKGRRTDEGSPTVNWVNESRGFYIGRTGMTFGLSVRF